MRQKLLSVTFGENLRLRKQLKSFNQLSRRMIVIQTANGWNFLSSHTRGFIKFTGINAVLYFSSLAFQDFGITDGALASLFVGITNPAGALGASYLMDKHGRKKLLVGSSLGMAVSMFLIVCDISLLLYEEFSHNVSILGTLLYMLTFAVGAGPVTGLIIPELSSRTRGKIMGFCFSVHWVCNFLVGLFFLDVVEIFGLAPVYAGFSGVSFLSALLAYYFNWKLKGHSLEEIEMSVNPKFQAGDK